MAHHHFALLRESFLVGAGRSVEAGVAKGVWTLERIDISQTGRWVDACTRADLIWIESPSNPMLCVADLKTICAAPRRPAH